MQTTPSPTTQGQLMSWHALIIAILLAQLPAAAWRNQTIDDDLGDSSTGFKVLYEPLTSSGGGAVWKSQDSCETCAIKADRAKTYKNTWTSTTYLKGGGNYTAAMQFHGTAIYIYFVISNYPRSTGLISVVECAFRLDGAVVGNYTHESDESYTFQYNTLVYAKESLSNSTHNFLIEMSRGGPSYVIFDYAQYTTDTLETTPTTTSSTPSSSVSSTSLTNPPANKRNMWAIVGGILGGLGSLAWIVLAFCLLQRRRGKEQEHQRDLQMQSLIKGDSLQAHLSPNLLEEHAELEQQLREQRTAAQNSGALNSRPMDASAAVDDSDLRQQVISMRLQLQRLETQQATTTTPPFTPYRDAVSVATAPVPAGSTATHDSVFSLKREQTRVLAAGSSTSVEDVVVHTDSGLRLGAVPHPVELPPTYALE